jgi:hypothetical protein
MATNTKLALLVIFFCAAISQQSTCNKTFDCAKTRYHFVVEGFKTVPLDDTLHLHDTLWFSIETPTRIADQGTGSPIDYSNSANLGILVSFGQYAPQSNPLPVPAADSFGIVISKGSISNGAMPSTNRILKFDERGGKYTLTFGLALRTPGKYVVLFSNATNVYRHNDECTKATFDFYFTTNQHLNLNPNYTGPLTSRSADYYFVVK